MLLVEDLLVRGLQGEGSTRGHLLRGREPRHRRLVVGDRGLGLLLELAQVRVRQGELGPGLTGLVRLRGGGRLRAGYVGGGRTVVAVGVRRGRTHPEDARESEHSRNPSTGPAHATTPSGSRARSRPNRANLIGHRSNRAI